MTDYTKYVDPDASGSATGDDWTNAYTSQNAARVWAVATMTTGDRLLVLCRTSSGTADTVACNWNNLTAFSAWGDFVVRAATAAESGGAGDQRAKLTWDATIYRMETSGDCCTLSDPYMWVKDIQIKNTDASPGSLTGPATFGSENCIFSGCHLVGGRYTLSQGGAGTNYAYNNIIRGAINGGGAVITNNASADIRLYSSVCIPDTGVSDFGVRALSGTIVAKNVYAHGTSGNCFVSATMTTCASSDTTGSSGLQSIAYSTATFTNVTSGSEDFTLVSGSSLIDGGTDTSGDSSPMDFTTDILGNSYGATWDVGPSEYQTGTSALPLLNAYYYG